MKKYYLLLIFLLLREVDPRPSRKAPAYAKPVYADSFLPAAMQVIFYAVEQLKAIQLEEAEQTTPSPMTTIPTTMSHMPGQHQPESTELTSQQTSVSTTDKPALSQEASVVESESSNTSESTTPSDHEIPELGEETPEVNYGTPETNHEMPEEIHETQEVNQENAETEKDDDKVEPENNSSDKFQVSTVATDIEHQHTSFSLSSSTAPTSSISSSSSSSSSSLFEEATEIKENNKKREPTVDSVVREIYGIMKPQNGSNDSTGDSSEKKDSSKNTNEDEEEEVEDEDKEEHNNDDSRYTLLGEKATQVPRPSLSNYLRRSKIPPKCSIQQLALLYDALSKDARKQGFAKFSGYSDEVLKTLETSAEGGIGPQLEKLLEKILERNEVTRDDAKVKIVAMLEELNNPASEINRDLRALLPLRFNP